MSVVLVRILSEISVFCCDGSLLWSSLLFCCWVMIVISIVMIFYLCMSGVSGCSRC